MWWLLVAIIAAMSTPAPVTRGLAPMPEPNAPEVQAAPIERVYLPIVSKYTPLIEGADVTLYGYATQHEVTPEGWNLDLGTGAWVAKETPGE